MITTKIMSSLSLSSNVGFMSSPKEDELQSPFLGNDTNLLSLQEILLGCTSKKLGNLLISQCFNQMD
jgi:hypothetical protein